jgi:hypothetical protein
VKIDNSLVDDPGNLGGSDAIVHAVTNIACRTSIETAEFAETEQ